MVDFLAARRAMVDSQLLTGGVSDARLMTIMGRIPREIFVPESRLPLAYIDDHHALSASGRFLAAPATFARLVQLAAIRDDDSVLDIGTASGYSAAVLAGLGRDVVGVESDGELAAAARANLAALAIDNVIVEGERPSGRSFDVIVLEGAVDAVPPELLDLLAPDGRLVALHRHGATGIATLCRKEQQSIKRESHFNATLPPLSSAVPPVQFVF